MIGNNNDDADIKPLFRRDNCCFLRVGDLIDNNNTETTTTTTTPSIILSNTSHTSDDGITLASCSTFNDDNEFLSSSSSDTHCSGNTVVSFSSTITSSSSIAGDSRGDNGGGPHYSFASVDPPPGVPRDPSELWVALDDGNSSSTDTDADTTNPIVNYRSPTPVAPWAVLALARTGLHVAVMDPSVWSIRKTQPLQEIPRWQEISWEPLSLTNNDNINKPVSSSALPPIGARGEDRVLLWSSSATTFRKYHDDDYSYGSELPAGRTVGIINMSPKQLCDLLIDSARVGEYNKLSSGRQDLFVLHDSNHHHHYYPRNNKKHNHNQSEDDDGGNTLFGTNALVTKVICCKNSIPVLRRTMEVTSLLHARELPNETGYLLVTRSVLPYPNNNSNNKTKNTNKQETERGEILMGVNVIRRIDGEKNRNRCLLINVFHFKSGTNNVIPMSLVNRMAPSSAVEFVKDLQHICSRREKR